MTASPETWAELQQLSARGVAMIIATCDPQGVPELCRAWGFRAGDAGGAIELSVYAGVGRQVLANLAANPLVAVTIVQPSTYRALQMKGRAVRTSAAGSRDRQRVLAHQQAFVQEVAAVGLASAAAARLVDAEQEHDSRLMTLTIDVDAVFDQTPGPGAGARL